MVPNILSNSTSQINVKIYCNFDKYNLDKNNDTFILLWDEEVVTKIIAGWFQ